MAEETTYYSTFLTEWAPIIIVTIIIATIIFLIYFFTTRNKNKKIK
jgi:type II secretory pathway component PulF